MAIHQVNRRDWPRLTWKFPRMHNYEFRFGLDADDATIYKHDTIVPYIYQNNAIVDYEDIKTNPQNADFGVVAYGDTCAGSYIPFIDVGWDAYIMPADTEMVHLRFDTMMLHTSMLNRLDAFDKKTNDDIETILELQHATDDEITFPLYQGASGKLYEGSGAQDLTPLGGFADIGLTTDGQLESVAWDKEKFFDAMHYYTNKEMLKTVTDRLKTHIVSEPLVPHGRSIVSQRGRIPTPSLCKFQHPYTFCGQLFSIPQVGSRSQYHFAATAVEHLTVKGWVRFNEFNPDFNFARA